MRRRSTAPIVRVLTDTQRIVALLDRLGQPIGSGKLSANHLYRLVCAVEKRSLDTSCGPEAQWVFLRAWLRERSASVATTREPPPFREFAYPPAMRAVLARCREHAHCRSSCQDESA